MPEPIERVRGAVFMETDDISDSDKRRLVLIERNKTDQERYFVFPGGGIEDADATERDALVRELVEELGIHAVVTDTPFLKRGAESFFVAEYSSGMLGSGIGPEFSRDPGVYGEYIIRVVTLAELIELHSDEAVKPVDAAAEVVKLWQE